MEDVKYLISRRLSEKNRKNDAQRIMTILFVLTSTIIFSVLLLIWIIQSLPTIKVPPILKANTIVILFSSFCIIIAQRDLRNDNINNTMRWLSRAIILAIVFLTLQIWGWYDYGYEGNFFKNILLPITVLHFMHVITGTVLLVHAYYEIKNFHIHSKNDTYFNNVSIFWHFLGILWFMFMIIL